MKKCDEIAHLIRDRIKTGRYREGQRLTTAELCTDLGGSKSTILTALGILTATGEVIRGSGYHGAYTVTPKARRGLKDGRIRVTCPECNTTILLPQTRDQRQA